MKFILLLVQATGSLDASNMFKPALARGEINVLEQQH
jgi:ATP-dependent Clp protease ATP-binding subunit ClpA